MRKKLDIEVYGVGGGAPHRALQPSLPRRLRRLLTWVSQLKRQHPQEFEGGASRDAELLLRYDWEPKT